jgi:hypothetical protein
MPSDGQPITNSLAGAPIESAEITRIGLRVGSLWIEMEQRGDAWYTVLPFDPTTLSIEQRIAMNALARAAREHNGGVL